MINNTRIREIPLKSTRYIIFGDVIDMSLDDITIIKTIIDIIVFLGMTLSVVMSVIKKYNLAKYMFNTSIFFLYIMIALEIIGNYKVILAAKEYVPPLPDKFFDFIFIATCMNIIRYLLIINIADVLFLRITRQSGVLVGFFITISMIVVLLIFPGIADFFMDFDSQDWEKMKTLLLNVGHEIERIDNR